MDQRFLHVFHNTFSNYHRIPFSQNSLNSSEISSKFFYMVLKRLFISEKLMLARFSQCTPPPPSNPDCIIGYDFLKIHQIRPKFPQNFLTRFWRNCLFLRNSCSHALAYVPPPPPPQSNPDCAVIYNFSGIRLHHTPAPPVLSFHFAVRRLPHKFRARVCSATQCHLMYLYGTCSCRVVQNELKEWRAGLLCWILLSIHI